MTDATADFFDELGRHEHEPNLAHVTGTMCVELLDGERTDHYLVALSHGDIAVSHVNAEADIVLRSERALFDRLARGETNPMAAALRGDMTVQGDLGLLVYFQRLFPGPPHSSDDNHTTGSRRRQS